MTKEKQSKNYDVIIVGGGLAGLSLSCILGHAGLNIACIEKTEFKQKQSTDQRTTAISYGSMQILEKAGITKEIKQNACPIRKIEILDGASPVLLNFMSDEVSGKIFGWIVENPDLFSALLKQIKSLKNINLLERSSVHAIDAKKEGYVILTLQDRTTLKANLIIGADGRSSFIRSWMEEEGYTITRQWSYNQRAIVCTVIHEKPHNDIAVEHFFSSGPFAILPMSDNEKGRHRSALVFTEHGPEKKSLMRLDDKTFLRALTNKFPARYGDLSVVNKRMAFPLGLVHASNYIAPRIALIADSAHGIHPIAGQGLNLGFRDIREIANLIIQADQKEKDIGDSELLKTYQRRRRPDNMAMVAVTDGLNRLFSNNILPLKFIRKAGLRTVSRIPPAKRFFMRQAMGDK